METQFLRQRVVFVKDPTALPNGVQHHDAIDALAKNNRVVILLSHGNKYRLPKGWLLPHNVKLIEYDLTVESIEQSVNQIRSLLRGYGVDLYSRHLDNDDPMPMLLAGACMTLSPGTKVAFVNKPDQYSNAKQETDPTVNYDADWDL